MTPLYDLLTDKDGNPLPAEPRARYGRVGFKERMGPGRWPHVIDADTHEPLVFPLTDSFGTFHRAVGGRPGHYQLAILDENHRVISKELVGHLTITPVRNGAASDAGGGDPVITRMLALIERGSDRAHDTCDRMIEHHAASVTAIAELVKASAEMTRALLALAPGRLAAPVAPATEAEADDDEEEPTAIESLICQGLTGAEMWWELRKMAKQAAVDATAKKPAEADTSSSAPNGATPHPPDSANRESSGTAPGPAEAPAATQSAAPPAPGVAPAPTLTLSPEQQAQMLAVMSKLTGREQLAVKGMVMRMTDEVRATWLAELSTLTIDQAVERIRDFLPEQVKGGAK